MRLLLKPVDTWFFRSTTSMDMGESPQAGAPGLFPPFPRTVAGALRAAVARHNGWDGRGRWPQRLERVLGDGPEDFGAFRVTGPLVVLGDEPLFAMPRHVLGHAVHGDFAPQTLLRPGAEIACDAGSLRLPEAAKAVPSQAGRWPKEADGAWVTLAGLRAILQGALPSAEQIVASGRWAKLCAAERRIGIARNPQTHAVEEGALYSTWHARLDPQLGLGVEVAGVPPDWDWPATHAPLALGGEGRLAAFEPWSGDALVALDRRSAVGARVTLVVVTPLVISAEAVVGAQALNGVRIAEPAGLRIVSAALDRPLRVGGWDSLVLRPLSTQSALAPGSTLFCTVARSELLSEALDRGWLRLGQHTAAGFGLCAVGTDWEEIT